MARWKPIDMGPYRLSDEGLVVTGDPSMDVASGVGDFLHSAESRCPFWIGDWWNDAQERWPETCYQLVDATGFELATLNEYARVARRIPSSRRWVKKGVSFTVHQAVSTLDEEKQREVLAKAQGEGMSTSAVRDVVNKIRRAPIIEGEAKLRGTFRVAYIDPDYRTISLEELMEIPLSNHMRENAALFLWCPEPLRFDIKEVLDEWEFEHRTAMVWDRVLHQGPDRYLDVRHEHLLWCVRGKCPPDNLTPMLDSVVTIRRGPEKGHKPEEFREMIERLYDTGPYVELLTQRRRVRQGWTFYGRQLGEKVA